MKTLKSIWRFIAHKSEETGDNLIQAFIALCINLGAVIGLITYILLVR